MKPSPYRPSRTKPLSGRLLLLAAASVAVPVVLLWQSRSSDTCPAGGTGAPGWSRGLPLELSRLWEGHRTGRRAYDGGTWSVVAADPETGDVGMAGATCLPTTVVALASVVPGRGVAAVQADFEVDNRDLILQLLQDGRRAEEIINAVANESHDERYGQRQYGVVTLHEDGVRAVGFTGHRNNQWAGDVQAPGDAVSVQGNFIVGHAVIADGLAAFRDETVGPLALSDRLLRALEAGSAAGGDLRCNNGPHVQTALSAFLVVARADDAPYSAAHLGVDPEPGPSLPWLVLTVTEPAGGGNPLLALRRQYDAWRMDNLPDCPDCDLRPVPVPPGLEASAIATDEPGATAPVAGAAADTAGGEPAAAPAGPTARGRPAPAATTWLILSVAALAAALLALVAVLARRGRSA